MFNIRKKMIATLFAHLKEAALSFHRDRCLQKVRMMIVSILGHSQFYYEM